jgi:AAA+ ATPase superfamily predicted ATPase
VTGNGQSRAAVFGREPELAELRTRLAARKPFLFHGNSGVGKSLLIRSVLTDFPDVLYCNETKSPQSMFRALAESLSSSGDQTTKSLLKWAPASSKSAVSLKGIVLDSLRTSSRAIVLDQLVRPSQALGAAVKELALAGSSVVSVARSAHMEDAGYVFPLYPFREERFELHPLDASSAAEFSNLTADRLGITADNRQEFLDRVLDYAKGNPGVILALLRKGTQPRYRAGEHIKIGPLYIDFRLEWNAIT